MPGIPIGGGVNRSYQQTYDKNGNMGMDSRGQWGYVGNQDSASVPMATAAPVAAPPPAPSLQGLFNSTNGGTGSGASAPISASGGSGDAGPSGARVLDPASDNKSPAMQGLMSAAGGDSGGAAAGMLTGPTKFRNGIGSRMIPDQQSPLSGNRRLY